jgi:uncharacterized RDD family membrane protein YckC
VSTAARGRDPRLGEGLRPASLGQRTLAWSIDFALLAPLLLWLAWPPLAGAIAATLAWLAQVQAWMFDRMLAADGMASPLAMAQALLADPVQGAAAQAQVAQLSGAILRVGLLAGGIAALYFVAFEACRWQATPGKRLLGLRVETTEGARLSIGRALLRHVAGLASWLTLNLGHLLVALRSDRRALHDLIAGTRVTAAGPLPPWGRALLAVLSVLAVLAPVWGVLQVLGRLAGI